MACRKALSTGSALALRLGDPGASRWYSQQASSLTSLLLSTKFRYPNGAYRAYASSPNGRRGVDSAVLLAILVAGEERDPDFSPTSPAVLASVKVYVDAFRGMYVIANGTGQREGTDPVPTGRYPGEYYVHG
ncbi:hypothetical protein FRC12_024361 [Ceratobasidium sp. 428]|nr:hypothetical protein FRC12_024361 [Ceratobasidium sp. 428]